MKRSTWKKSVVVLLVALLALLAACEQTNNPSGDVTGDQSSKFCNVVFDTNGGSTIPTQQVEKNSIIQPPKTERTGYTFAGWSYDCSIYRSRCLVPHQKSDLAGKMGGDALFYRRKWNDRKNCFIRQGSPNLYHSRNDKRRTYYRNWVRRISKS